MAEIKISFAPHRTIPGLDLGSVSGTVGRWAWTNGAGPLLLRFKGRLYIASDVYVTITNRDYVGEAADLRFGPGGRKHYALLTEGRVEEIASVRAHRKNTKEEARAAEIARFGLALIDAL